MLRKKQVVKIRLENFFFCPDQSNADIINNFLRFQVIVFQVFVNNSDYFCLFDNKQAQDLVSVVFWSLFLFYYF